MAVITAVDGIKNVAGSLANGFIAVKTKKERGFTGTFIDTREYRIKVVDGELIDEPDIIAGPVTVTVSINSSGGSNSSWDQFDAVIPEAATVDLWALKELTYTYDPPVIGAAQAAAAGAAASEAAAEVILGQIAEGAAPDAAVATHVSDTGSATRAALNATYAPAFGTTGITYNGDGSVATVTENGITTTYTYNGDGTVHTDTRLGVTRTYTYDGSGNLTGIAS